MMEATCALRARKIRKAAGRKKPAGRGLFSGISIYSLATVIEAPLRNQQGQYMNNSLRKSTDGRRLQHVNAGWRKWNN